LIKEYNGCVQGHILPRMEVAPAIHPLDCTKVEVNPKNDRYEGAGVVKEGEGGVIEISSREASTSMTWS
jgi:hypothetical protein